MLAGYELTASVFSNPHSREYSLEVPDVWHRLPTPVAGNNELGPRYAAFVSVLFVYQCQ